METKPNDKRQKKGFWAAIRESMTKTGGCCGSGENCCGPSNPTDGDKKAKDKKDDRSAGERNES